MAAHIEETGWRPLGFPSPPAPGPLYWVVTRFIQGAKFYLNWVPWPGGDGGAYAWSGGVLSVYTRRAAEKAAAAGHGASNEPAPIASITAKMKQHPRSGF